MQLEDQVDDLGRIHSLLDILSKRHLVNANLVWQGIQFVFEAELGRLILHSKVDGDNHGTSRQSSEGLDTALRLHVDTAVVIDEGVAA